MEHWLDFVSGFTFLAVAFGAYELNKITNKLSKLSEEHQEIKEEIQKLSKKLAK